MTQETTGRGPLADGFGLLTRLTRWRRWAIRVGLVRKLMLGVTLAAVVAGVLTVYLLLGSGPTIAPDFLWALLFVDLALLLSLIGLVTWWLIRLWALRRAGVAGARLHGRLIAVFAVLAIMPAITVAALAAMFFNFEVRSWFSDRVREAVNNSVTVAEAYLGEHKRVIAADALAMANDLNREWASFISNPRVAGQIIETQAALRALQEAIVFDASGRLIARTGMSFSLELSRPEFWALEAASDGEVVILTSGDDRVRALVGLQTVPRAFLYVGRFVDPTVVGFMERTQEAASEYQGLQDYRARLQVQLAAIFVLVALFLLLVAVAAGLGFANRLARPMGNLVHAAERVRDGDLSVRVEEQSSRDEFGVLTRAFNRMTRQLEEQRGKLMDVNRQLDDRRLFIETVLAGVSAGVIGLDADGRVNLPNRSAVALLGIDEERLSGARLGELVPGMAELLDRAKASPERLVEDQVNVTRDGRVRTLLVRIAPERGAGASATRSVVTFDDITELLSAQRKAAWADVARRIAHEIKNPLTPIQLSAERLQRKYLPEIRSDPQTFRQCTDTIVRQVGDIGQMIDEFSSFARMPRP
ncbi:MAG: HAMP domain-containing protein, partial [Alphaproteobacteria bacterium]